MKHADLGSRKVVLVIDDEHAVRGLVAAILSGFGVDTILANDVTSGLALLKTTRFDLVITDINLGRESGMEVLRYLHTRGEAPPAIAMSGAWTPEDRAEARRLPGVSIVDKPFTLMGFCALLRGILETPAPATESAKAPTATVLVVDDDSAVANLIADILASEGFEAVTAPSAREGFRLAGKREFDLMILDVVMPGEDGLSLLGRLRQLGLVEGIPVLFVTADSTAQNLERARALGAAGMLSKPFDLDRLVAAVKTLLGDRSSAVPKQPAPVQAEGDLGSVPVSQLCRLIDLSGRSVVASLVRGPDAGELVFDRRGLVSARLVRSGVDAAFGDGAFLEMARWSEGRFSLTSVEADRPPNVDHPVESLLRSARGREGGSPKDN
ncbi:MAG: response regulator [Planctomycetes bacterium]|nr:response regulator [Planctomycetota bacterium]